MKKIQKPITGALDIMAGGIVIVPMLVMSVIYTITPGILDLGGFTSALFSADNTQFIISVLLFIAGTQLDIHEMGPAIKRGGLLSLIRILIGFVAEILVLTFCGLKGIFGISALSLVIALLSCNPGVYMAVCQEHGDRFDIPGFGIMNLVPVPAIPVILFGFTAGVGMDYISLIATFIPFFLGMICGNIDQSFTEMVSGATPVFLLFMGISCGVTMNWRMLLSQLGGGTLLTCIYFAISLPILILVDRIILKRPGYAAVSMTSISPVSIIMPAAVAAAVPEYAPYTATASAQIALAVALTNLITPFICQLALKKWGDAE